MVLKIVSVTKSTLSHDRLLGKSAQRTRRLGKVSSGDICRRFIADAELEASRAPVNKLDRLFRFDVGHSSLDILGDNVPAEEETASHCQIDEEIRKDEWKSAVLYLPSLGSHFTIWFPFSKHDKVMSRTEFCSCPAFSAERRGA